MSVNWNNPNPPRPDQVDLAQPVDWSHPQARGLAAWWPFWLYGALQSMTDMALRRYAVTPLGSPTLVRDATFPAAVLGNGSNAAMDGPYGGYGQVPITLSVWMKASNFANYNYGLSLGKTSGYGVFGVGSEQTTGKALFYEEHSDGTGKLAASTAAMTAGTWNLSAGVADTSTTCAVYLNGTNKGTQSNSLTVSPSGLTRASVDGLWYRGSFLYLGACATADARVYNRALSDAEMYNLWHPGRRWGMIRTLTGRRTIWLAPAGPSPWFFRNLILRRGRSA